jgi:hypothetical protein
MCELTRQALEADMPKESIIIAKGNARMILLESARKAGLEIHNTPRRLADTETLVVT